MDEEVIDKVRGQSNKDSLFIVEIMLCLELFVI